ncbi:13751_t:CDS:2 [Racocetra persica]|uniref:13751_t:CDS:1 n=1 Tax=Racocetra persica TaxID=160502 RepID=A0ACA9ME19_9GLOM|nr:13751_t:CDS:2 [Racocetra persica]
MEYRYGHFAEVVKFDHPVKRDIMTIPSHSQVKFRFQVGNTGVWAFHFGILAQFVELPHKLLELSPPPNDTTFRDKAGNNVILRMWEGLCEVPLIIEKESRGKNGAKHCASIFSILIKISLFNAYL